MASSGTDVIQLLEADHRQAEQLLARFDTTPAGERDSYFCEVVNDLVRHEVAEEVVVYPAIRKDAPGGDAEADAHIREQSRSRAPAQRNGVHGRPSAQFKTSFRHLRDAVLGRAQAEENGAFRLLQQSEDPDARMTLGQRYETAKRAAPTHPHPHAPDSPPGNVILGPIAAVFDKAPTPSASTEPAAMARYGYFLSSEETQPPPTMVRPPPSRPIGWFRLHSWVSDHFPPVAGRSGGEPLRVGCRRHRRAPPTTGSPPG